MRSQVRGDLEYPCVSKQQFSDEAPKSEGMCGNKFTSNTINIKSDPRSKALMSRRRLMHISKSPLAAKGCKI